MSDTLFWVYGCTELAFAAAVSWSWAGTRCRRCRRAPCYGRRASTSRRPSSSPPSRSQSSSTPPSSPRSSSRSNPTWVSRHAAQKGGGGLAQRGLSPDGGSGPKGGGGPNWRGSAKRGRGPSQDGGQPRKGSAQRPRGEVSRVDRPVHNLKI